ncbi:hypothetical protein DFH09DRAFT_1508406 [Mycena vulgaris]|nr:hypothetical protein DFH09DRAFT_1508406 [Mycena vulgaris]
MVIPDEQSLFAVKQRVEHVLRVFILPRHLCLKLERQMLHVYGPGSFLNAQKSVPSSDAVVGSLVVIFPTAYGGAFSYKQTLQQMSLVPRDNRLRICVRVGPCALVLRGVQRRRADRHAHPQRTSRHLTYDLVLVDRGTDSYVPPPESALVAGLQALLADPAFLPAGGFLASGLAHKYPIPLESGQQRGMDGRRGAHPAEMARVGLVPRVQVLYDTEDGDLDGQDVLAADIVDLWGVHEAFVPDQSTHVILRMGTYYQEDYQVLDDDPEAPTIGPEAAVHWPPMTWLNRVSSPFTSADSMIQDAYGDVGLFVRMPTVGEGIRASVVGVETDF